MKNIIIYIITTMLVIVVWVFYPILVSKVNNLVELDKLGQLGDIYGGLNALFAGLAMIGLFLTLHKGIEERKQKQFEEHFFQQLELIRSIISDITLQKGRAKYYIDEQEYAFDIPEKISGRRVFMYLRDNFKLEKISQHKYGNPGKYNDFYETFLHRILGHYFRVIYNTIRYIDSCQVLNNKDKIHYAHMLRAQISSDELFLLFYNGLSKWGNKFKRLAESYHFFEHLHNEVTSTDLIKYEKNAYGNNDELLEEYKCQKKNQDKLKQKGNPKC